MDYQLLRDELDNDPMEIGYAQLIIAGAHNRVADEINRPRYTAYGPVSISDILIWAAPSGIRARLRVAENEHTDEQVRSIAEVAWSLTNNPNIPAINLGDERVVQMFDILVAGGVITQEERDGLFAVAAILRSRAEVLFGQAVSVDDVSKALAL